MPRTFYISVAGSYIAQESPHGRRLAGFIRQEPRSRLRNHQDRRVCITKFVPSNAAGFTDQWL